jgi:hypothetical protein
MNYWFSCDVVLVVLWGSLWGSHFLGHDGKILLVFNYEGARSASNAVLPIALYPLESI